MEEQINVISRRTRLFCSLVFTLSRNLRVVIEQCHVSPEYSLMRQTDDGLIYNETLSVDLGKKEIK